MSARLSIPQPCPANWEQMTPAAGGRYCATCEKVVVDFTRMSEAEVLAWLSRHGRTCGRFGPGQLAAPPVPRSWATWLAAAAVALSGCESAPPPPSEHLMGELELPAATATTAIRGRVLSEDGAPLAGAFVSSRADTAVHTRTQPDGSFELVLPAALADSLLLVAQPPTAEQQYVPRLVHPGRNLVVRLRLHPDILGEFELQPGETILAPTAPPPPPPKLSTVKFTPPKPLAD
ncbi:carboxypeptidase regulatory-like domain-containing protein [Hymenobacter gummosus]|uniref:Carboxypeptidase regulatory-like domain-containing protein n=1 Tax=Hymenobacter gummosus TaxID=1776032 RepID=A0A3S0ILF4_9BACT|nr:carboxypeptidase-like regulatory domain-containing protein [Hymenobacter gummosus]RTQ47545.1 carboxypeptidase regulatory-like domain-containing protein [Hymenobacter gummosus]